MSRLKATTFSPSPAKSSMRNAARYQVEHAHGAPERSPYENRPISDLWKEYRKSRSTTLRNYLIERFLPLVRFNAERVYARLPDEVDLGDLISAGLFGLMDAIDAFDPTRGVKFETYCAPRIRGAILDELRSMDWVPRLVRHRTSRVEHARQQFEMTNGRSPTDDELSRQLQLDGEEFDKFKRDSSAVTKVSLSRKCFNSENGKDVREVDVIKDETQSDPLFDAQRRDIRDLLTKGLSRAERLIVVLYYYEELTMKEIGITLDLSESRVSQMHSSILARLKAQMQHRERDFEDIAD